MRPVILGLLAGLVMLASPQATLADSCGEMGGNYCSQTGSCPGGYSSLGDSDDCHPCCVEEPDLPSCGELGGDHCSQNGHCPSGYSSLGSSWDCNPCCNENPPPPPPPSCGELGGNYCSQNGSCPGGASSLGPSADCHPCCLVPPAQPSCGALGGEYCSQTGSCPSGYSSLGPSSDCNPCCNQEAPPLPTCGAMGGEHCSQSGLCPSGYSSLGPSSDCNPCCNQDPPPPPAPSCGEMGGNHCSQTGSCPAGYSSLGPSRDCNPCCVGSAPAMTCGEMGGTHCDPSGTCPTGFTSLGESSDCAACCRPGLSCGEAGGTECRQSGECPPGYDSLGATWDCPACCQPGPSCGAIGGDQCAQGGASCPAGTRSIGITWDCDPCCKSLPPQPCGELAGEHAECSTTPSSCPDGFTSMGPTWDCATCCAAGPSCGEAGGDHCSQTDTCPDGFSRLATTWDCPTCCTSGSSCVGAASGSASCSPGAGFDMFRYWLKPHGVGTLMHTVFRNKPPAQGLHVFWRGTYMDRTVALQGDPSMTRYDVYEVSGDELLYYGTFRGNQFAGGDDPETQAENSHNFASPFTFLRRNMSVYDAQHPELGLIEQNMTVSELDHRLRIPVSTGGERYRFKVVSHYLYYDDPDSGKRWDDVLLVHFSSNSGAANPSTEKYWLARDEGIVRFETDHQGEPSDVVKQYRVDKRTYEMRDPVTPYFDPFLYGSFVRNGFFEHPAGKRDGDPVATTPDARWTGPESRVVWTNQVPNLVTGPWAVRLKAGGSAAAITANWIPVRGDEAYRLSGWVRRDSSATSVYLDFNDGKTATESELDVFPDAEATATAVGVWQHVEAVAITKSNTEGVKVRCVREGTAGDAFCDGITLQRNQAPVVSVRASTSSCTVPCTITFEASAPDPERDTTSLQWSGCATGTGPAATCTFGSEGAKVATVTATDRWGDAASASATVEATLPVSVQIATAGACSGSGCTATFTAEPQNARPPSTFAWSGCGTATTDALTCTRATAGTLTASVTATDARGFAASASVTAGVYASAYSVGAWGACDTTGASWTCTANTPTGCTRQGTQQRTVTETAWTIDPAAAQPAPAASAVCTETTQGYVASYASTYASSWTCTAVGATGCYKDLLSSAPSTFKPTSPSVAAPPARIYTYGYVAAYAVGGWSGCSASCGGGWQYRSVTPSAWKATSPDVARPSDGQPCNTHPCQLTCYDYPTCYPTKSECYGSGWKVCEVRYRDDGVGGLLTCWKGF
jgi:hypothetical protein